MKLITLSLFTLLSVNAFAGSPYATVKCVSEDVSVVTEAEGCTGAYLFKEKGHADVDVKIACDNQDAYEFFFEVDLAAAKNQFQAGVVVGDQTYFILGYDSKRLDKSTSPTAVKSYSMKANVYRLSNGAQETSVYKDVQCEVATFLMD